MNQIAWLRATCPEASFRDGKEAVEAARQACNLTKWKQNNFIDTLAASYAEAGEFDKAVAYQTQANSVFSGDVLKEAEKRLALYREHKPYRQDLAKAMTSRIAVDAAVQAEQAAREK